VLEDDDVARVGGRTVDEFARQTRREVCGPQPGDADFEVVEFTAVDAPVLTGLSVNALGARCARGTLPSRREAGKYILSEYDLVMAGLLKPSQRSRNLVL